MEQSVLRPLHNGVSTIRKRSAETGISDTAGESPFISGLISLYFQEDIVLFCGRTRLSLTSAKAGIGLLHRHSFLLPLTYLSESKGRWTSDLPLFSGRSRGGLGRIHDQLHGGNPFNVQAVIEKCMIGEFGVCIDNNPGTKKITYVIAGTYNGGTIPEDMQIFDIPAAEWAKFRCVGPLPGALQAVNTEIFKTGCPVIPTTKCHFH
jgi:hypothetical protein